jgi:hypothetical protein
MSIDRFINGQARWCRREQLKAERERDKAACTKPQPGTAVAAYRIWDLVAQYLEVQAGICEARETLATRTSPDRHSYPGKSDLIILH